MNEKHIITEIYRSEADIEKAAMSFRARTTSPCDPFFDPVVAIQKCERELVPGRTERLKVYYIDTKESNEIAFVQHSPLRLNIREETMLYARIKAPQSLWVLDHELGHIAQHDFYTQPFSHFNSARVKWEQKEKHVEWQADTFARYLRAPRNFVLIAKSPTRLADLCKMPRDVAELHFNCVMETEYKKTSCTICGCESDNLSHLDGACYDCLSKMLAGTMY